MMTLCSSEIERARGLPGFTQYQSHVLHIRHIDTRLSIDHVTAKLLHGALELAEIRKSFRLRLLIDGISFILVSGEAILT